MNWQFDLITFPLIFSAVLATILALYSWRYRSEAPWVMPFVILSLALAEWSTGYAFELAGPNLAVKITLAKIEYLGIVLTPVAWFLFAIHYSGRTKWLGRHYAKLFFVIPLITLLLVITNESHGWIWSETAVENSGSLLTLAVSYGWWFWVHSAYSYVLVIAGTIILLITFIRFPPIQSWQIVVVLLAPVVPLLGNGLYLSGLSPIPNLDLAPSSFTISGLIFAWAVFRFRLFQIGVVARRTVVDNMSDALIVLDMEYQIMDVNSAAATMLGTEMAAIIGQPIVSFLENGPDLIARFGKNSHDHDVIVLDIQEQQQWYEVRISPIKDTHDALRGRVLILRDINERKQSEANLAKRNQILQTLNQLSQEMSSSLELQTLLNVAVKSATEVLDATSAYICDWDIQHGTTTVLAEYLAPAASDLEQPSDLGVTYSLREDFGYPLEWIFNPNGDFISQIDDPNLAPSLRAHMEKYGARSILMIPLHAKGKALGSLEIWESRHKREFNEEEITMLLAIGQHVALAMDNAYLYEQALEINKLKTRILARVSHELRTPLSIIKLYTEMLFYSPKYASITAEGKEMLNKIIIGADDLSVLIDDLLDQSIIETGTLAIQTTSFSPAKLLKKINSQMDLLANERGLKFNVIIDADVPEVVKGDINRVQQILVNLIGNAVKFTEKGTISLHFCTCDDKLWAMKVSDTGIGISPETQRFIFEPFRQGDHLIDSNRAGIGLGLSIVKQLVDLMGGEIIVESELGKGSTFTVLLPVEERINDKSE